MIWIGIIGGLALAGFLAVQLGFFTPPHAATIVQFRGGRLRVTRGELRPLAKSQVAELLNETGVPRCFIAITPGNRVIFSRGIPSTIHQQLRNVILNQWA